MDVGIMVEGQEGLSWQRWRHIARLVEDLGFESLWRSDHLFSQTQDRTLDALEPFVSLAVLAVETSRMRFGPLVSAVTFRHPSIVARMAAQIDELSGGRLVLGMGAAWFEEEHDAFGIPFPPRAERFDRLDEALHVVRALWSDGPARFKGQHYQLRDAECYPKPVQRPMPILVGGNGEQRTLRIVAAHANEWNAIYLDVETYRRKREVLAKHCEDIGRDPSDIRSSMMLGYIVARDEAALPALVERLRATGHPVARAGADPTEAITRLRRRGFQIGSADQLVDALGRYEEAGVSRVMLHHLALDDDASLELLASDVLPQVQRSS